MSKIKSQLQFRTQRVFCLMILTLICSTGANAQEPFHAKRPFWVVGHNPNTLEKAQEFLIAGSNALEPDVQARKSGSCAGGPAELMIAHDPICFSLNADSTLLVDYLKGLSDLIDHKCQWPADAAGCSNIKLGLITFDVKPEAADPSSLYTPSQPYAQQLVDAIETYLLPGHPDLRIVLSVGTTADAVFFDALHLGSTQTPYGSSAQMAIQIDGENDPGTDLYGLRSKYPQAGGYGYGTGTALCCDRVVGPNTPVSIDKAVWLRTAYDVIDLVPYAFTVTHRNAQNMFLGTGVDGLITDDDADLKARVQTSADVCYAMDTGCDPWDPDKRFLPLGADEGYALEVKTADFADASAPGTDAYVTFALVGKNGKSSSATVDASFPKRFELSGLTGSIDHVYIHSEDLGVLDHVEVSQDGSGGSLAANGAYSAMNLDWIKVRSALYMGVGASDEYVADYDPTQTIEDNQTYPAALVPQWQSPHVRIEDVTKDEWTGASPTSFEFLVTLTPAQPKDIGVYYQMLDANPVSAVYYNGINPDSADYVAANGNRVGIITFKAGETSKFITANVTADNKVEADETFLVKIADSFPAD